MTMIDSKNFTQYLSANEISDSVQAIAKSLNRDYQGKEVILVAVLKGAMMFIADLARQLEFDFEVEFVRLSSHGKTRNKVGTITMIKDIATNVEGKHVLIVEEVVDSGRSLEFLLNRIRNSNPASLEVVTMLDKEDKRSVDVTVKYVGQKVDDRFVVGYGLDLEEGCRNLPDIYTLKYPN